MPQGVSPNDFNHMDPSQDDSDDPDMEEFLSEIAHVSGEAKEGTEDDHEEDHEDSANPSHVTAEQSAEIVTASMERPPSPPASPEHPHFYSEEHGKYLKKTEYGTMEFLPAVQQWIPWFGSLGDDDAQTDEAFKKYQEAAYGPVEDDEGESIDGSKKRKRNVNSLRNPNAKRQRKEIPTIRVDGIPLSVTTEMLAEAFSSKCGLLLKDEKRNPKIVYFENEDGGTTISRSALLTFLQEPSVNLAITLLDDTSLPGTESEQHIRVRRATTEEVKQYSHTPKLDKNARKQLHLEKRKQLKQVHWTVHDDLTAGQSAESSDQPKYKVLVLKYVYTQQDLITNPNLKTEVQKSLWSTCSAMCQSAASLVSVEAKTVNPVKKVKAYVNHPEGVVVVHFRKASDAAKMEDALNGKPYKIQNASVPMPARVVKAELWKNRVSEVKAEFGGKEEENDDMQRLHAFVGSDDEQQGEERVS